MSKKKVGGNTMTLKDFHGGSIPSDLPLPSAPGVIVRPSDRPGYDRPASWGNQMGRPDHRSRPHTSPATRHLDDKAPFLTHASHIGRNFDEDERKPLDGVSAPRRTISDESIRAAPARPELKHESASGGGLWGREGVAPTSQVPSGIVNSYSGRVAEANLDNNVGQGVGGVYPNAWAARKEAAGVTEPLQSPWSAPIAVSKLAHASALEKVSSGRWQSKLHQSDAELVSASDTESGSQSKGYNKIDAGGVVESYDATLARHGERARNVDDYIHGGRKEFPDYGRTRTYVDSEVKEKNLVNYRDRGQPDRANEKFVGAELQTPANAEPLERPKLKLLPRTKPLESLEHPVADHVQGNQKVTDSVHDEDFNEAHGNQNPSKSGLVDTGSEKQAIERPKLNLKPRSQPAEQLEGNVERDRNSLFGGARPRELVLKERGVDDVTINHDLAQHPERVEHHVPRAERNSVHPNASRYSERTENPAPDQRFGKRSERRDHEVRTENPALDQRSGKKAETRDVERVDTQRRNWRSENRRNNRETEKQHQQPERAPSPDTWRKPVEQPKPFSADAAGLRYGKAASAVELAQAFSKSSISVPTDRLSGQRSQPGRAQSQIPFSRLMGGPTPRPQINGY